jgi:hypothetical protein
MSCTNEGPPELDPAVTPPLIRGTADLTHRCYQGQSQDSLLALIRDTSQTEAAYLYDSAIALQLGFHRDKGLDLLDAALAQSQVFRIGSRTTGGNTLRVLALVGPGDLMVNTPLDFITNQLDVRLDLLYVLPGQPLPPVIPDHDIAFFALGEADAPTLIRLQRLFNAWPRPALNNPRFLPAVARDTLSRSLAGVRGICSPTAVAVTLEQIEHHLNAGAPLPGFTTARGPYPCLIRPESSHAGHGLAKATSPADLAAYLRRSFQQRFFITAFEDYGGPDGLYRKYRVAFIEREPFLCHMAISQHWMVHYLNAGMTESAEKRAQEARAMAAFNTGFAYRHAPAFAALHQRLGFDYYSIDCAETRDGRLLVFEADAAAIIHLMDPPELFPYKQPQMRKVFDAFGAMLLRRTVEPAAARGRHRPPSVTAGAQPAMAEAPPAQIAISRPISTTVSAGSLK